MKKIIKFSIPYLLSFIFLSFLYVFLYKILMPRVNAFGCFDDCFNYMGGYFILKGKKLYSEIFFNHQPFMAYISYAIQAIEHPRNIYELVLRHRQFLFAFSFIMNLILLIRFKLPAAGFILFYEFTKFYIFGDRFLAESFIVYPLVYLAGLTFYKIKKTTLSNLDYILSALFTWFVIFMREPYILVALFFLTIIFVGKPFNGMKKVSIFLFIFLTGLILFQLPLKDYFFNMVAVTSQAALKADLNSNILSPNIIKVFFYPVFILFATKWNIFQQILAITDIIFILLIILYWTKLPSKILPIIILISLGLANLRMTPPGKIFYDAFHMIQWYGLFLFFTFLMINSLFKKQKKTTIFLCAVLTLALAYFLLSPASYIHEKTNPQYDLITNYGNELQVGEVVRKLSSPSDTLFLDGSDDLIYWQADRISPYKYSWYTSGMRLIPLYQKERLNMFSNNPPDFYYKSCSNKKELVPSQIILGESKNQYIRLYNHNEPSCLFVNEKKIPNITQDQWKDAAEFGYTLDLNRR